MVIGITGGVGSGKSTVLNVIRENKNCFLLLTDDIAKKLQEPGESSYKRIVEIFGTCILNEDKTINNSKLAELVFENKEKLELLNNITHPNVINYVSSFINSHKNCLIILESALLLDTELKNFCDSIWFIYVSENIRRERLKLNRNYTDEKINKMIKNQKSEKFFFDNCDIIIYNEDFEEMKKNVIKNLQYLNY